MLLFYWMVSGVLAIWMIVRIWRTSPLLAVLSLLVPFVILIALFKMWGNPDSDIRLPFVASLLVAGLMFRSIDQMVEVDGFLIDPSMYIVDDSYLPMSPEDLEYLREDNPALAVAVERRQAELMAQPGWSERNPVPQQIYSPAGVIEKSSPVKPAADYNPVLTRAPASRNAEAERLGGLRTYSQVAVNFDAVRLETARVTLQLPQRYRFVATSELSMQSRLRGIDLRPETLGWVLHETAKLSEPEIWYVNVAYLPIGYLDGLETVSGPDADELAAASAVQVDSVSSDEAADASTENEAFPPHWDAEQGYATWVSRHTSGDRAGTATAYALRPLRHGVLLFHVDGLTPEREELGLRASRLMASRAIAEIGARYEDYNPRRDQRATQSLHELMGQGVVLAAAR